MYQDPRSGNAVTIFAKERRACGPLLYRLTYDDVRKHAESVEECSDMLFVVEGVRQTSIARVPYE